MLALLLAASVTFVEDSRLPESPVDFAPASNGEVFLVVDGPEAQTLALRDSAGDVKLLGRPPGRLMAIAVDDDGATLWGASREAVYRRAVDGTWSSHALVRAEFRSSHIFIVPVRPGRVAVAFAGEGIVIATAAEMRTRRVPDLTNVVSDGHGGVWVTAQRRLADQTCLSSLLHLDETWRVFGDPIEDFPSPEPLPAELAPPDHCSAARRLFPSPDGAWIGDVAPKFVLSLRADGLELAPSRGPAGVGVDAPVSPTAGLVVERVPGEHSAYEAVRAMGFAAHLVEITDSPQLGEVALATKSAGGHVWVMFSRTPETSIAVGPASALGLFTSERGLIVYGHPKAIARLEWAERRRIKNTRENSETASPYRWGWGIAGALVGLSAGTVATAQLAHAGWGGAAAQIGVDGLVGAFPIGLTMWAADEWLHTPAGEPAFLSVPGTILGTLVTLAVVPAVTAGTGLLVDPEGHGGYGGAVLGTVGGLALSYGLHALFEKAPVRFQRMLAGMLTGSGATLGYRLARTH